MLKEPEAQGSILKVGDAARKGDAGNNTVYWAKFALIYLFAFALHYCLSVMESVILICIIRNTKPRQTILQFTNFHQVISGIGAALHCRQTFLRGWNGTFETRMDIGGIHAPGEDGPPAVFQTNKVVDIGRFGKKGQAREWMFGKAGDIFKIALECTAIDIWAQMLEILDSQRAILQQMTSEAMTGGGLLTLYSVVKEHFEAEPMLPGQAEVAGERLPSAGAGSNEAGRGAPEQGQGDRRSSWRGGGISGCRHSGR